jgi:hypothetical protein
MPCSAAEAQRFQIEVLKCRKSFPYFCDTYCQILSDSGQGGAWVPFRLWPEQRRVASRDLRLVDLAIALLRENELQTDRVAFNSVLGQAYHIRGDDAAAVRYTEQAATLQKAAKPMSGIEQESTLAEFAERIAEYKKMVKPPSKEK